MLDKRGYKPRLHTSYKRGYKPRLHTSFNVWINGVTNTG